MAVLTRQLNECVPEGVFFVQNKSRNPTLFSLASDSRDVQEGSLYASFHGVGGVGLSYLHDALAQGAVALLLDESDAVPEGLDRDIVVLKAKRPRAVFAQMVARFYHHHQPDHVIAITGTSGKTSVAAFLYHLLKNAGLKAASLGTLGLTSEKGTDKGQLTTPGTVALHQMLAKIAQEGITHLVMEASSHGLDQHRLDGVRLKAGGFTNLGRDHMDYHKSQDDYFLAKARLFSELLPKKSPAAIFVDSEAGENMAELVQKAGLKVLSVGRHGDFIRLKSIDMKGLSQEVSIEIQGEKHSFLLPLAGEFQVYNALIALALALELGVSFEKIKEGFKTLKGAPGRLELIGETHKGASIFLDYAHKPDAMVHVLKALRPMTAGRLFIVFGAGGDRDQGKRPIMGDIAQNHADRVIVTDDNPRFEDPALIREAILSEAPDAIEISDREEAIYAAIEDLQKGDVLVVAGKGHETGQIIKNKILPFSDRDVILKALRKSGASS